jgi:DNA gyrase subunit A
MPEKIIDNSVTDELSRSYLEYSMSVIVSRALPDVRDGLKPVHRRILYSMYDQGLRPERPHSKCAKVVGDTMGRFHPHGDSAIYEALVRLAQHWSMRVPVVDPHGNFGSPDDGPAAPRYTECRMSAAGAALLEDIREDTVDFEPNYDGTETQPTILPAAFPNLLVNGSQGIAVGMATNMAPHNLGEVVSALQAMLVNPKIGLDELMTHLPGPDLPTGAIIHQLGGVREAYETGRGTFKMRARARIVDISARKKGIEITELPYQVGAEKVIAKIKDLLSANRDLKSNKKLQGVVDIKALTDRKVGLCLLIECKTGFNPAGVLEELYRLTPLEESFGVNAVCLVDGKPQTLGLVELCRYYLDHRYEVVTRRTQFRLKKAEERAHIIEGLLIALARIEEIVAVIKGSRNTDTARKNLMKTFILDDVQSDHILGMPLRRLTSLEVTNLKDEMRDLRTTITALNKILRDKKELTRVVSHELNIVVETFDTPRRTELLAEIEIPDVALDTQEPDEPCVVALSVSGTLAKYQPGPKSKGSEKYTDNDAQRLLVHSTTKAKLLAVTSSGRLHTINVAELPLVAKKGRGNPLAEYIELDSDETVVALLNSPLDAPIGLVTSYGIIKRLDPSQLPSRTPASVITLEDGDHVVAASPAPDESFLVIVSSDAQLLRTPSGKIRPQGRAAGGVGGMKLYEGARVVGASVGFGGDGTTLTTVTDKGTAKTTLVEDYPEKGRGGVGVRCMRLLAGEAEVVAAAMGLPGDVLALDAKGAPISDSVPTGRRDGSGAKLSVPVVSLALRVPNA